MPNGAIAAMTLGGDATCAVCGRVVTGHHGDVKILVEHVFAVLCSACFDQHPNREEWTCWKPGRFQPRRMLRIP